MRRLTLSFGFSLVALVLSNAGQAAAQANLAFGSGALDHNTSGNLNSAFGMESLFENTTGSNNTAVGFEALDGNTTGNNNIDLGNAGVAAESSTIRIGTQATAKGHLHCWHQWRGRDGRGGGGSDQRRPARHRDVFGALQTRHPRHGHKEQRFAQAASGELPLQQRPGQHLAVRSWWFTAPTAS